MRGGAAGTLVPTTVAQYAFWSQGRRYPVKPNPRTRRRSARPTSQFSSRGFLYAPKTNVRAMWRTTRTTIAEAPQWCSPRTSPPAKSRVWIAFTLSHAWSGVGAYASARAKPDANWTRNTASAADPSVKSQARRTETGSSANARQSEVRPARDSRKSRIFFTRRAPPRRAAGARPTRRAGGG